ncbi:MAG TPA: alpha-amylase family glycosyl hydrolase [Candidatus Polarisedimenticolaceae bacterium]|nr:alpha-amylase family glycosyl hydrolase [Candidatus Polarisedimenticolaceae bacterium]
MPAPSLFIGQQAPAGPAGLAGFREIPLVRNAEFPELFEIEAAECGLDDGRVCFYWFKVRDADPYRPGLRILYCTDPTATTVDRRFTAPLPPEPGGAASGDPPAVLLYAAGRLVPCDPGGASASWDGDPPAGSLSPNHHLVIYELPTRWTLAATVGDGVHVGTGTFRDALALVERTEAAAGFADTPALGQGVAHLLELGANALELLPPEDSDDELEWGYGTANYFAADFDLGRPRGQEVPTASSDLAALIAACHRRGVRFFLDLVMAFARNHPYRNVNYLDFFVRWRPAGDPERDPEQGDREGFGGDLFKFHYRVRGYHPRSGAADELVPARACLEAHLAHWMAHYRIDGLRLDSVNNIASPDFLREFRDRAHALWADRGGTPGSFLVVAEDLAVPLELVREGCVDGLWNERFKQLVRQLILGRSAGDADFETCVRRMIDCRQLGFADGAQAVNYLTSHDVAGFGNERLHDYLRACGVEELERRIKLAFVCLLTAVGIPLILAGEEFADAHDLPPGEGPGGRKQVDPVNYNRLEDPWRRRVFDHVARLVRLRTSTPALGVNDTEFLHADFAQGKRVVVWQRGRAEDDPVIVVANFSDWGSTDPSDPRSEYVVPGFPAAPAGRRWREATQERSVPAEWAGREPLYPWEAKVYALEPDA